MGGSVKVLFSLMVASVCVGVTVYVFLEWSAVSSGMGSAAAVVWLFAALDEVVG